MVGKTRIRLWVLLIGLALAIAAGCSSDDDETAPVPADPVVVLVQNGGGTGGGAHAGTVTVVVFDEQDHTRIAGATVVLDDGSAPANATTDDGGIATFTGVASGAFHVTVVASGYSNATIFGVQASIVAMPMGSPRITVEGTVLGAAAPGNTFTVAFSTFEDNPYSLDAPVPEYGAVLQHPTGSPLTWRVEMDKGATDTLVFTETTTQGEIVNRKSIVVGPHTTDQTGVNVTFDGTTGLYEITGTLSNLSMVATTVRVVYRDRAAKVEYLSYGVTGTGVSRSYSMKIPAGRNCLLELESYLMGQTPGFLTKPNESQTFVVTAGAADNATVPTVDLTYSLATVTGTFSNYGAATAFPLLMRFGDIDTVGYGTTALGYSVRVPAGVQGMIGVQGQTGTGLLERGQELAFGPYNINSTRNFDLAGATPNQTDITTNIPTGIGTHTANAILLGIRPNEDVVWFPFAASGTVGASNITASLRHYPKSASKWLFMIGDDSGSNASSGRFIGNITDPAAFLGTTQNITLLNVPDMTAPANGATPPAQVQFAWNLDGALSGKGFSVIDIREATSGDTVWTLIIEGSLSSATLPALPGSVSGFELQTTTQYVWSASAMALTGFDFNDFQIDTFKGTRTLIESGREVRMASTNDYTFTVN